MTLKTLDMQTRAVAEDDSFDLDRQPKLSPETLARGTRYATDDERARLTARLAQIVIDPSL